MFLLISHKYPINDELKVRLIRDVKSSLNYYDNELLSIKSTSNTILIKWSDKAKTSKDIYEGKNCYLLEEGLFFYKENLNPTKYDDLLNDYMYEKDIVKELDGHFVLIILDKLRNKTIFINDAIGLQHSFIYSKNNFTVISNSLVLCSRFGEKDLDYLACNEFLSTGNVFEDRTIFKNIKRISGGHIIIISNGEIVKQNYWLGLSEYKTNSIKSNEAIELISTTTDSIIKTLKYYNNNIICDLTGGFDSRFLLLFLLKNNINATFTVSGDLNTADVQIAKIIANKFDLKLKVIYLNDTEKFLDKIEYLSFLTNGTMSILPYLNSYISHILSYEKNCIHITGTGGELIRWDWPKYEGLFAGLRKTVNTKIIVKSRFSSELVSRKYFIGELRKDLILHFTRLVNSISNQYPNVKNVPKVDFIWLITRLQCWGGAFRNANTHIQPIITPFLTLKFMRSAFSIHYSLKRRHYLVRKLMYEMNEELSSIETEIGMPYQTVDFNNIIKFSQYYLKSLKNINKLKKFIPSINSIPNNSEIDKYLNSYFTNKDFHLFKTSEFFDKNYIDELIYLGMKKNTNENLLLWRLLTLEEFLTRCSHSFDYFNK